MARIDKNEVLSHLQHEAEDDSAERKAEDVCAEMNDPWWPANQEPIPEQYSTPS